MLFQKRIKKACTLMQQQNVQAMYLHAGTNLFYFTGMKWNSSERMVGALLFPNGKLHFIAPEFEKGTIFDFMLIEGTVHSWEEHESPHTLLVDVLMINGVEKGLIFTKELALRHHG